MKKIIFIIVSILLLLQGPVRAQINRLFNEFGTLEKSMSAKQIDSAAKKAFDLSGQYPDSAISILSTLCVTSERHRYDYSTANILIYIGSIFTLGKGNPLTGLHYYHKAYPYLNANRDTGMKLHIRWYGGVGGALATQGWHDSAIIYFSKAMALRLQYDHNNLYHLAALYANMGVVYKNMHQLKKALLYLKKAEDIAVKNNFINLAAITYNNLIMLFIEESNVGMARQYLRKMETLPITSQEERNRINIMNGKVLFIEHQYKKAIPFFQHVLASGTTDKRSIITSLEDLGNIYYSMKNYKLSKHYYEAELEVALKAGINGLQILGIYDHLAEVNKAMGNYKEAYGYIVRCANMLDSANKKERQQAADELEIKYRTLDKEKELNVKQLQLVSAENNLNKKTLQIRGIVSAALILFFISVFFIQRQNVKLQKARIREKEQKIEQLKAVIDAEEKERSRIGYQLHDDVMLEFSLVKMNMTTFSEQHPYLSVMTAYTNITQQLDRASIKLRQTARNLMPETVLEDGLVAAIHYFCNSVQKISNLRITFQNYSDLPKLPIDTEVNLYRMVQELIQNVIKHAEASAVLVQIGHRARTINITVEDNGKGIENMEQTREGMGLKGIQSRLQAIQGVIDIYNIKPHGTSVNIEVQV